MDSGLASCHVTTKTMTPHHGPRERVKGRPIWAWDCLQQSDSITFGAAVRLIVVSFAETSLEYLSVSNILSPQHTSSKNCWPSCLLERLNPARVELIETSNMNSLGVVIARGRHRDPQMAFARSRRVAQHCNESL